MCFCVSLQKYWTRDKVTEELCKPQNLFYISLGGANREEHMARCRTQLTICTGLTIINSLSATFTHLLHTMALSMLKNA